MKNKKLIIVSSVILTGIAIGITLNYFFNKDKSNKIKSILFIGDSNTFANFSYADQLKKMFPNLIIKKIAQNGANTGWMAEQLYNELAISGYNVVVILGGSNDIYGGKPLDYSKHNLDEMYKMAHNKGSKVLAVTPPNKDFYVNKTDAKQKQLDDLIDWIKNNKNKDYFIDFKNLANDKKYFTSADGYLHPQASAHKLLAEQTINKLNLA